MNIAILGCGTIGGGVADILRGGVEGLKLVKILDRPERFDADFPELFTDNAEELLSDPNIDAVVETLGGRSFAYACVKTALEHGKHVVTANKELISYHLKELSEIAERTGAYLLYEAAVGGGIPFMKTLSGLAEFNETKSILGILNGTTNYVLTRMQKEGLSYEQALECAQKAGFAEANPDADVLGADMARKIAILAMLAFRREISPDRVYTFGIRGVTKNFIDYVNGLGYTLKFVCFANADGGRLEIGVEPILVSSQSLIAKTEYENNFVTFDTSPNGALTFIGKGAGRYPTASAVVSDLITVRDGGKKMVFRPERESEIGFSDKEVSAIVQKDGKIKLLEKVSSESVRNGGFDFYGIIY